MRFFFYGTLLDADLRRALCGPAADGWSIAPATLADHRRGRSPGRTYPILLPAPGETVGGVVAGGLDPAAAAMLTLYEGNGYRVAGLHPTTVEGPVSAWVYLPRRGVAASLPWALAEWQREHKARALRRIAAWVPTIRADALAMASKAWAARSAGP